MFRILTLDDSEAREALDQMQDLATAHGLALERVAVRDPDRSPWEQYPDTTGRDDLAWLMPLESCPSDLPDAWCITALGERRPSALALVFPPGTRSEGQLLGLPTGAEVRAAGLVARYLHSVRPDVTFSDRATVRVASWLTRSADVGSELLALHPREFPPPPGAGVWAWITHPDALPLRRLLKALHHPETVRLTNIERDLARRFRAAGISETGIYAETDRMGNILVWMAWSDPENGILQRAGISGSSPLGLADLAWAKTGLNFEYFHSSSS